MAPEICPHHSQEGLACSNDHTPAPHITRGLLPTSHRHVSLARAGCTREGAAREAPWAGRTAYVMLMGSLGALFGNWEPWRHLGPWRFFGSDETHPSSRCTLSLWQPLSLRSIAEVGLSPWGVRSHFEEGKQQPSEFLNSGTVDVLGQIIDSEWLGLSCAL